jgi:glutathione S-transferase
MHKTLFIGPKNYSSWSLRPWLALKWGGIDFTERLIRLDQPGYGNAQIAAVRAISPSGLVPALHLSDAVIWDSLAISEWAAEQNPTLWPRDALRRAQARSATAEMHAGFAAVRRDLPMNIKRRCPSQPWVDDTQRALKRLFELLGHCRDRYASDGPWLFGERSIADAFYAPIATRLRTYSVTVSPLITDWMQTVFDDSAFREWEAGCEANSWDQSGYSVVDRLYA